MAGSLLERCICYCPFGNCEPLSPNKRKKLTRSLRKKKIQHWTFCFSKSYGAKRFSLRTDMCNKELRDLLKHHRVCGVSALELSLHCSRWRRTKERSQIRHVKFSTQLNCLRMNCDRKTSNVALKSSLTLPYLSFTICIPLPYGCNYDCIYVASFLRYQSLLL